MESRGQSLPSSLGRQDKLFSLTSPAILISSKSIRPAKQTGTATAHDLCNVTHRKWHKNSIPISSHLPTTDRATMEAVPASPGPERLQAPTEACRAFRTWRTTACQRHRFQTFGSQPAVPRAQRLSRGTLLLHITHFHEFVGISYLSGLLSYLTGTGQQVQRRSGSTQTHITGLRMSGFLRKAKDTIIFFYASSQCAASGNPFSFCLSICECERAPTFPTVTDA